MTTSTARQLAVLSVGLLTLGCLATAGPRSAVPQTARLEAGEPHQTHNANAPQRTDLGLHVPASPQRSAAAPDAASSRAAVGKDVSASTGVWAALPQMDAVVMGRGSR